MANILAEVEKFLLPSSDDQIQSNEMHKIIMNPSSSFGQSPINRLEQILYDIASCDHIRTLQTIYRDNHDEQNLSSTIFSKERDLEKEEGKKFTTKNLIKRIIEGRSRVVALSRICYGDDSIEMLRAIIDLGNAYAIQGMWPQVNEHMEIASHKLSILSQKGIDNNQNQINKVLIQGRHSAAMLSCTYKLLRKKASENCGQITVDFIPEIISQLREVSIQYPSPFKNKDIPTLDEDSKLASLLNVYFSHFGNGDINNFNSSDKQRTTPSWGNVIDFFRNDCHVTQSWLQDVENALLPQNKAILLIPFRQADLQNKGVSHPVCILIFIFIFYYFNIFSYLFINLFRFKFQEC
jgi:hypothetical protein